MTDLDTVDVASSVELQAEATRDGLDSLLYHFLDELLFHFSAEYFVPKTIDITKFDREALKIDVTLSGEEFDLSKHPQKQFSVQTMGSVELRIQTRPPP